MAIACTAPAHARDWVFEPQVSASAIYTDNANLSDSDPEDAMILTLTPGFSITSQGSRRVRASLQYGLRGVARIGYNEGTDVQHNLSATGNAELVEDFLFVDGSANVSQELVSLFGSTADAEIDDSNRATVGTYSISPYVRKRLGTFAVAQARYTTSGAIFENDVSSDSRVNSFSAGLASGTRFGDLSWGLDYSIRKADYDDDRDATFESARATAGYALTRKFRVFGTVGHDWNDYFSTSEVDGSFYSVGVGWSPTRRTSLEASVGERYFGRTYAFSGSHRTRLTHWTVSYTEDVSDITRQLLETSSRTFWACPLSTTQLGFVPVTDPAQRPDPTCQGPFTSAQIINALNIPDSVAVLLGLKDAGIANGIYIIKSFNAGVSWELGRLGFGLTARDTRRLYQELDDAEDRVQGVTGAVSYRMSPHTTANSTLTFTRNSADPELRSGVARDDDIVSLSLGLSHRFTEDLNGALTFRHTQRDSNEANSDYQENRLTATVNMRF